MAAITIGSACINRAGEVGNNTIIAKENPANASGKITKVYIWAQTTMLDVEVAIFELVDTNTFTTRSTAVVGDVVAGDIREFDVDLDVVTGDYIGIVVENAGRIERDISGTGYWLKAGDYIPCTNEAFTFYADRTISLGGVGAEIAGWTGSMWFGSEEVVNPASIMGVAAANIQSVKGVASS